MTTMDGTRSSLFRLALALALACAFPAEALASPLDAQRDIPGRFDTAVASGLPATLEDDTGLIIRQRLTTRSTYSDGEPVELYDVRFRGQDALAFRHGANLRIASIDERLLRSTTYAAGRMLPVEHAHPLDSRPLSDVIDTEPERGGEALSADVEASRDLHVFAFVHDDVPLDDDEIFERFFGWWIKRMEFDVLEDRHTHVHLRRDIPGVTDPSYGHKGALLQWMQASRAYVDPELPAPVGIRYIRNILLVKGAEVEPGAAGVAHRQPGSFAMASTAGSIAVPAHEIGHMLGASHDHAERRFAGPFSTCDTIMYPVDPTVVCKTYSLPNVSLIRGTMNYVRPYVRGGNGFIGRSRWPED